MPIPSLILLITGKGRIFVGVRNGMGRRELAPETDKCPIHIRPARGNRPPDAGRRIPRAGCAYGTSCCHTLFAEPSSSPAQRQRQTYRFGIRFGINRPVGAS